GDVPGVPDRPPHRGLGLGRVAQPRGDDRAAAVPLAGQAAGAHVGAVGVGTVHQDATLQRLAVIPDNGGGLRGVEVGRRVGGVVDVLDGQADDFTHGPGVAHDAF